MSSELGSMESIEELVNALNEIGAGVYWTDEFCTGLAKGIKALTKRLDEDNARLCKLEGK